MTTRWEKGDEHLRLIVEGQTTNLRTFKSGIDINIDGNILIDCTKIDTIDKESIVFLNNFGIEHKAKNHSVVLASSSKLKGLKEIEVVPTITEAKDLIFMEITERELGFFGEEEIE
jgi:hypothetical protein